LGHPQIYGPPTLSYTLSVYIYVIPRIIQSCHLERQRRILCIVGRILAVGLGEGLKGPSKSLAPVFAPPKSDQFVLPGPHIVTRT